MTDDRESLEELAETLDSLQREGDAQDKPEGARYVRVSHTLMMRWADILRKIAQRMDSAAPNDWD